MPNLSSLSEERLGIIILFSSTPSVYGLGSDCDKSSIRSISFYCDYISPRTQNNFVYTFFVVPIGPCVAKITSIVSAKMIEISLLIYEWCMKSSRRRRRFVTIEVAIYQIDICCQCMSGESREPINFMLLVQVISEVRRFNFSSIPYTQIHTLTPTY